MRRDAASPIARATIGDLSAYITFIDNDGSRCSLPYCPFVFAPKGEET